MTNYEPLPVIQNSTDLKKAIGQLKKRIRAREESLAETLQQVPKEGLSALLGTVLPVFLSNKLAGGIWLAVKGIWQFFRSGTTKEGGNEWRQVLVAGARQAGLFALLRTIFDIFGGKKAEKGGKI